MSGLNFKVKFKPDFSPGFDKIFGNIFDLDEGDSDGLPTENLIFKMLVGDEVDSTGLLSARPTAPDSSDYYNPEGVYPDYTPTGNTYYVRMDGTKNTLAAATSPLSASTSLGIGYVTNSIVWSQMAPGDTIVFSSRGGDFTERTITVSATSGTIDNPITIRGEIGYLPIFKYIQLGFVNYVDVIDMAGNTADTVSALYIDTDYVLTTTDIVGIRTYNFRALGSTNQGVQHEGAAFAMDVEHYNLYCENCDDESVSVHGDNSGHNIRVYGGVLNDGVNWVGSPTIEIYDAYIERPLRNPVEISTSVHNLTLERCTVVYDGTEDYNLMDFNFTGGSATLNNNIFYNVPDEYLCVFRSNLGASEFTGNTVVDGDSVSRTTSPIYNSVVGGDYSGNTFYTGYNSLFQYTTGDITDNTTKYVLTTVSGSDWSDWVHKFPRHPELISADDGTLFTSSVPNEIGPTQRALMVGDQFFFDANIALVIYATVQVDPALSKIYDYFGLEQTDEIDETDGIEIIESATIGSNLSVSDGIYAAVLSGVSNENRIILSGTSINSSADPMRLSLSCVTGGTFALYEGDSGAYVYYTLVDGVDYIFDGGTPGSVGLYMRIETQGMQISNLSIKKLL
jgi:hypothetical protein